MYASTQPDDLLLNTDVALPSLYTFSATECEYTTARRYHSTEFPSYIGGEIICEESERTLFETPLQSSGLKEGDLLHVTDPLLAELDLLCDSPGAIWNYKGPEGLDHRSSISESPLALPTQLGEHSWDLYMPIYFPYREPSSGSGKEPSVFSCESNCSTYPTESASSTPAPLPTSMVALDRRKHYPLPGRDSRTDDLFLYGSSEPLKHRIDPIKPSKSRSHTQDTTKLSRCIPCNRQFTLRKDLERHRLSRHTDRPRYFCPIRSCPYAIRGFKRKDKAFQHVRIHQRDSNMILEPRLNPEGDDS